MSTQPKLLDRVRDRLRYKQYSLRTEQAYVHWIKRFIFFHGKRHPEQMNGPEVEAFLTHLAKQERVAAATQDQALSALLFLYKEVLQKELPWLDGVERPKRPARLPERLIEPLRDHLVRVKALHENDLTDGYGEVYLPFALARKSQASRGREKPAAHRRVRRERSPDREIRFASRIAAQLRHSSAAGRLRYLHGSGTARAQGRKYYDDLHPRSEQGRTRCEESA